MNGARALLTALADAGVEVCFANPGTSEMHFVAALDEEPRIRPVLTLFEGVASGAADGYARIAGKPASILLHLGSGLSNASANLHNARRAASPVVAIVGDHAVDHAVLDAPLTSDVEGLARPHSRWVRTVASVEEVSHAAHEAVAESQARGGGVATLILPADAAWEEGARSATPRRHVYRAPVPERVAEAARLIRRGGAALMLWGAALHGSGLLAAGRIAAATGVTLLHPNAPARVESGAGRVPVERTPYFAEQAVEALSRFETLILVGAAEPVAFFAYPGRPSRLAPPGCAVYRLAEDREDLVATLEALAEALGASETAPLLREASVPPRPEGALDAMAVGALIARACPADAIVVDEGLTAGAAASQHLTGAAPHDRLFLTGGAIGSGPPMSVGAAVAGGGRRVINLQGDGSAMYTLQALWTQARERLPVTTLIFANHAYAILDIELARVGARSNGAPARSLLSLEDPRLDWVALAQGQGVPAERVATIAALEAALDRALGADGPNLIEIALAEPS